MVKVTFKRNLLDSMKSINVFKNHMSKDRFEKKSRFTLGGKRPFEQHELFHFLICIVYGVLKFCCLV